MTIRQGKCIISTVKRLVSGHLTPWQFQGKCYVTSTQSIQTIDWWTFDIKTTRDIGSAADTAVAVDVVDVVFAVETKPTALECALTNSL